MLNNFLIPSGSTPFYASTGSGTNGYQNDYLRWDTTETLSEDLIARDIILNNTTLYPNGYRIYCRNLYLLNNSIISNKGADATGGNTGGNGGAWGSVGGGTAGGNKGMNNSGSFTAPTEGGSVRLGSLGGAGGKGGDGLGNTQGGAGGLASANYNGSGLNLGSLSNPVQNIVFTDGFFFGTPIPPASTTNIITLYGGAGGGGGYAGNTSGSHGGNGGGGGGVILICASGDVELDSGCVIVADGGVGSNGIGTAPTQGGGGGGGGGGAILITCRTLSTSTSGGATIQANGGDAGLGGTTPAEAGSLGKVWIKTPNGCFFFAGKFLASQYPFFPIK